MSGTRSASVRRLSRGIGETKISRGSIVVARPRSPDVWPSVGVGRGGRRPAQGARRASASRRQRPRLMASAVAPSAGSPLVAVRHATVATCGRVSGRRGKHGSRRTVAPLRVLRRTLAKPVHCPGTLQDRDREDRRNQNRPKIGMRDAGLEPPMFRYGLKSYQEGLDIGRSANQAGFLL